MNRVVIIAGAAVILMGLFQASGCGIQRTLLYQPERFAMEDLHRYAVHAGLEPWPSADSSYLGLIGKEPEEATRGTVVVFHGNAGAAIHRSYYVDALVPRGFRVIIAEYPGYGARPGEMSEESFTGAARSMAGRVRSEFGSPVYLWGESLGAGVVAAAVSGGTIEVDGVVLITPWDRLYNLARAVIPFLPVRFFMRDYYDTVENLAFYAGPKAVLMAERDEIIPSRLTENLYESLPEPKRLWIFEAASHNNWPVASRSEWWTEVTDFLENEAHRG